MSGGEAAELTRREAKAPLGEIVLEVRGLSVRFNTDAGVVPAVNDVSFQLRRGETLAIVGESGSGKSVTSLGILRLTPKPPSCVLTGQVLLTGEHGSALDLVALSEAEMRDIRGNTVSMVFQEPMTSLNPVRTIGDQIAEPIVFHNQANRRNAIHRAAELLDLVGIPDARRRLASYPHQLSGGMRQRAMIAMALSCNPTVLIADEPTTALDVTIQAQILELLQKLQAETNMAVIFITHNLGVVAEIADRVIVMYAGRVMEQAAVVPLFQQPLMPYTMGLLRSVPRLDLAGRREEALTAIPGNVPDPMHLPRGCKFHPRCSYFVPDRCDARDPDLEAAGERRVRCVRWREIHEANSP